MGAGNVKLVFANWADLEHHPFRVLVYMALTTKDTDHPPRYWDRWESLAVALGRMVPDETDGDEQVRLERQAALRAVNRATAELVSSRAVTIAQRASPGRNTVYELNLMPDRTVDAERRVNNRRASMKRSTLDGNNGRRSVAERSTLDGQTVDAERPSPRKDEKEDKDVSKEEVAGVNAAGTVSRANSAATTPEDFPWCGRCVKGCLLVDENTLARCPCVTQAGDDHPPARPSDEASPSACPHGNNPRGRRDGKPRCAICRAEHHAPAA